ncbi:MAG TPA: ATP-dependent 6-phosphofructokinase [Fimbriimonas sp.]|nr:ATP-dependent 6-phosphofructokinase [Fimbriimonas sp.]
MERTKRIGIINSGGDCAGLNAVIASTVVAGTRMGYEFVGFERGWEGLLSPIRFRSLDRQTVRGISYLGGTILGTVNRGRFGAKEGEGDRRRVPQAVLQEAKDNMESLGVDGLIVIGGDGTLTGASQLAELGVRIVGVPKTIDNDLGATDRTFGFSTAAQVVVDALDRIHTTASSHNRVILVETMGRHSGWIALRAGLAGGADAILIPEFSFTVEDFVAYLRERYAFAGSSVVAVAEGAKVADKLTSRNTGAGEVRLGGVVYRLMEDIERMAPGEFELRAVVLGHVQRGGTPNSADRAVSKAYGVAAVQAYRDGLFGQMVAYQNLGMTTVPFSAAIGSLKKVTVDAMEYKTARELGIFIH